MNITKPNFEFRRLKEKQVTIISHLHPSHDKDRTLGISHPEKPIEDALEKRDSLSHLLDINDNSYIDELISDFNQALENKSVIPLDVKKQFTIKGTKFGIADNGLVLSAIDYGNGAHLGTKLSGKFILNTATRNLLFTYLALSFNEPRSFIKIGNKIAEAEKWY